MREEKRSPKLSILVPVYNAAGYLEETIRCYMAQTLTDTELILVDDASTDGSVQIAEQAAAKDDRIRLICQEKNGGAGCARNRALEEAAGEYIMFADADDHFLPETAAHAVERLEKAGSDWVIFGIREQIFKENKELLNERVILPEDTDTKTEEEYLRAILQLETATLFGYPYNKLYKRSIIEENALRFTDAALYEDFFFNLAYAKAAGSVSLLAEANYFYIKQNSSSLTSRFVREYFELSHQRVERMLEFYREKNAVTEKVRSDLLNIYYRYYLSALIRNADKQSGMDRAARKAFVENSYLDPLYAELTDGPYTVAASYRKLDGCRKEKKTGQILMLGGVAGTVKKLLPDTFTRLKAK